MSKASARYRRTLILGVLAMATLIWAAIDQFGIPLRDMAWLFAYTAAGAAAIIVVAAIVVSIFLGLRKLLNRD